MNKELFDFYIGEGKDSEGRTFDQLISLTDEELEKSHNVIQYLFPLKEKSEWNPHAPVLDDETIEAMRASDICCKNLCKALDRLNSFLFGPLEPKGKHKEYPYYWLKLGNHNYLRITRMIKCLRLFGNEKAAYGLYMIMMEIYKEYPNKISNNTLAYWKEAIED